MTTEAETCSCQEMQAAVQLAGRCFEPSQPRRIISGLVSSFGRYTLNSADWHHASVRVMPYSAQNSVRETRRFKLFTILFLERQSSRPKRTQNSGFSFGGGAGVGGSMA